MRALLSCSGRIITGCFNTTLRWYIPFHSRNIKSGSVSIVEFRSLSGCAVIVGFLCVLALTGCSREMDARRDKADARMDPLEIRLCIDESSGRGHTGALIRKGVLDAHSRRGTLAGRKVELLSTDLGAGTIDSPAAAAELFQKERISGPALLCSAR